MSSPTPIEAEAEQDGVVGAMEWMGREVASIDQQWGRSESLDPDNVGDIADEGAGHRG